MPRRDGTGPFGVNSMGGSGLRLFTLGNFGVCNSRMGKAIGFGGGCGSGGIQNKMSSDLNGTGLLYAQKDLLEARLSIINECLNQAKNINK